MTPQENSLTKYKNTLVTSGNSGNNWNRPNLNPNNGGRLQSTSTIEIFGNAPKIDWNGYSSSDPILNWNSTSTNLGSGDTLANIAKWGTVALAGGFGIYSLTNGIMNFVKARKAKKAAQNEENYKKATGDVTSTPQQGSGSIKDISNMDIKQLEIYKGELESSIAKNKELAASKESNIQTQEGVVNSAKAEVDKAKDNWKAAKKTTGEKTAAFNKANEEYEDAKKATTKARNNYKKITEDISSLKRNIDAAEAAGEDTTQMKAQLRQMEAQQKQAKAAVEQAIKDEQTALDKVGTTGKEKEDAEAAEQDAERAYNNAKSEHEKAKEKLKALKNTDYDKLVAEQEAALIEVEARIAADDTAAEE